MTAVERTVLLGVPLARLGMADTLDWIDRALASGESHQIATANVSFLALARRDPDFLRILQDASLVTADGMPLCWASRLLGAPVGERVTGADLVPSLFALAARRGYRIFLMGPPQSTEEAARRLCARYPGASVVGIETPPYAPIEDWDNAAYCARIREARTDALLLGFGAPKQERWIARYLPETGARVAIGVGGTFDLVAGRVRRAPATLQAVGLEWLWRLCAEPRRLWRRYFFDAAVVGPRLVAQLASAHRAARRARRGAAGRARVRRARDGGFVLSLAGRLDASELPALRHAIREIRGAPVSLVVDAADVTYLAPTVLGELVALVGWTRATGGGVVFVESPGVSGLLERAGLDTLAPRALSVPEALGRLRQEHKRRLAVAA
ncbi:MAG TPA: WecB/TagA/CpsF family glycosyltransferase [Methylomirabilota bacterium]|jgi:N-acetylglucosaminyldiphosphoundecaprenol N-acetyl-beta-D-mannosaminyltransferase|nr:WecB/TagA/CpsF family glycosyltransferase [Methylomirabilota bacterium]